MKTKKIELLSPAKDAEVGMAAINHGADAVYIGGPDFGAREKASKSIQDIERLCRQAA
jgi:putative protease